jgi:hypothetical protein
MARNYSEVILPLQDVIRHSKDHADHGGNVKVRGVGSMVITRDYGIRR